MAEKLLTADEYLPELEELGFRFVEALDLAGEAHSVFENAKDKRFVYPGARGYPNETPMIPSRKLGHLLETARRMRECNCNP